jgi:phosphoribosylformimino-5-aminoimidazole carboxamide ribotide isomerase
VLSDLDWLADVTGASPAQVLLAVDVCERQVVTDSARGLPRCALDLVEALQALPLAGLVVRTRHKGNQTSGADLPLMEDLVDIATCPVLVAGGIGSMGDLWALQDRGVAGAVIGTALYTRALDARAVAAEFAE